MRWEEKYPNADAEVGEEQIEGVFLCKTAEQCFVCGQLTHWMDIDYQGWFCSEECVRAAGEDAAKR